MSPPDAKLLSFPSGARSRPRPRDPRIDAVRGFALVMIFIDHMPGNPYELWTLRNWGFSDAAEAFFVMSGVAAGLAYSGRFLPEARAAEGLWPAVAPMWKRSWTLYLTHLLLTFWAVAIFAGGADAFGMPALFTPHNLAGIFENPEETLFGVVTLGHQVGYVNILPTYSVLLLVAPAAILLGLRRPWLLAGLSLALWAAGGVWRWNIPNFPGGGEWFFSPFAWQAVFICGLLTGLALRRDARLVPRSRPLFWAAVALLVLILAWRTQPALAEVLNKGMWHLGQWGLSGQFVAHDKTYLALPRLLHVLALVYVISCLPWVTRACGSALAAPLRLMGRQGLIVFSAATLLALVGQVLMAGFAVVPAVAWLFPPLGVVALVAVAWLADHPRRRARAQRRDSAAPAAGRRATGAASA